jgi:hypothetical protein
MCGGGSRGPEEAQTAAAAAAAAALKLLLLLLRRLPAERCNGLRTHRKGCGRQQQWLLLASHCQRPCPGIARSSSGGGSGQYPQQCASHLHQTCR